MLEQEKVNRKTCEVCKQKIEGTLLDTINIYWNPLNRDSSYKVFCCSSCTDKVQRFIYKLMKENER